MPNFSQNVTASKREATPTRAEPGLVTS